MYTRVRGSSAERATVSTVPAMEAAVNERDYECMICHDIPTGEVHQCNGECLALFCLDCWKEIQEKCVPSARNCGTCRSPLPPHPPGNRNRFAERAIATLMASPATCETCGATMTRGELKEHEVGCRQREQQRVRQEQQRLINSANAQNQAYLNGHQFGTTGHFPTQPYQPEPGYPGAPREQPYPFGNRS